MIHETVALKAEVDKWRAVAGLSQNAFAKFCRVDPSIASRVLAGTVTSGPSTRKMWRGVERLKRRVVASATERVG